MNGQYPLTHGIYINDVELDPNCYSIAWASSDGGYQTAYIGRWHLYGSPEGHYERREVYVPRDYQLGSDYWKGFQCTRTVKNRSCSCFRGDRRTSRCTRLRPNTRPGLNPVTLRSARMFRSRTEREVSADLRGSQGLETKCYPWDESTGDPFQLHNLVGSSPHRALQARLEDELQQKLDRMADDFLSGEAYLNRDGLSHFDEVNYLSGTRWTDPWSNEGGPHE